MQNYKYYENFCRNYRSLRQKHHTTIAEISDKTGVSRWTIMSAEVQASPEAIDLDAIIKLCDYFDVSLIEMFTTIK